MISQQQTGFGVLEPLEIRKMLSTVNITDFGAKANDNGDDRGAILAAIAASKPGDTIQFGDGVFNSSDQILLASDRNYRGVGGATIRGRATGDEGQLFKVRGNNVTVTGLTLEGGGIFFESAGGGRNTNIVIDNNVFRLNTSGHQSSGITFTSGLDNTQITNNLFTGYSTSFGIYGYNYMNLTIANNEFVDIAAGMHIDAFGGSGNLLVAQNYISGAKGMGMEFQGTASHLQFLDNVYEHPNLSSNFNGNLNSFAYSLILDGSNDIQIKRNTVIAPEKPDGTGCRIGFEVGGDNTVVEDNYVNGVNHVLASNDGSGTSSILVKNNKFMNYAQGIGGINGRAVTQSGSNDGSTQLSWDINRAKPGRNGKAPTATAPADDAKAPDKTVKTPAKPTTPVSDAVDDSIVKTVYNLNDLVFMSDIGWESAKNGWGPAELDQSNGERAKNDGNQISLNGKVYDKGIGVAVNSEIVYDLNGKYSRFFADVGIDDSTGNKGSATFEVWADGVKIYDSGVLTGRSVKNGVNLKVDGVKELKLVTTNAGDGDRDDHADWAAARLLPAAKASLYF